MNKVVEILMERDGLSQQEAEECLNDTRREIKKAIDDGEDYWVIADIIYDELSVASEYFEEVMQEVN